MRTRATMSLLAAGLLLGTATACSTNDEPKTIRVTVTETVTQAPEKQAAPKNDRPLAIGDKKTFGDDENNVHGTVEVLAYTHTVKGPQPPGEELGGDSWATAEVKVCNTEGATFSVSQSPWSLSYQDGTTMETTGLSGGDMPKPEFPMDKSIKSGRCARGKIAFPVHASTRPTAIVYETEDGASSTEWTIPKA